MKYTLPQLNYSYQDLEPYIDAKTMEIHHTKHHQAYIDKLNPVVEKYPELANMEVEELLKNLSSLKVDEADRKVIQNHGGGHANHSMFWKLMDPASKVDEKLVADITTTFGSTDEFKKQFSDAALKVFGSGWAWLIKDDSNKLSILGLPNQDSPLSQGLTPILGLDVWEHAYYIKYQNKRADYINAWWSVIKLI